MTFLMKVSSCGHKKLVDVLLSAKADVSLQDNVCDICDCCYDG